MEKTYQEEIGNLSVAKLYKIENKIDKKLYIGMTTQKMSQRISGHLSKRSQCHKLRNAIAKYGEENFTVSILALGEPDYIFELEKKAITLFNSIEEGYNIKLVAKTSRERTSLSLKKYYETHEARMKGQPSPYRKPVEINGVLYSNIKQACKDVGINYKTFLKIRKRGLLHNTSKYFELVSEEGSAKRKASLAKYYVENESKNIGRKLSEEQKMKISAKSKGKRISEEQKRFLSESRRGEDNPMFGKLNNHRSRSVEILGVIYPSISEAVRQTDMTKSMIEKRLQKNISGYKYVEDNN
jgi:group I intron endonuclease